MFSLVPGSLGKSLAVSRSPRRVGVKSYRRRSSSMFRRSRTMFRRPMFRRSMFRRRYRRRL